MLGRAGRGLKRGGQVVVEMLLILPVFLTIVFTIMEMGHLAFWVIVLNHATYEVARIGAMRATPPDGGSPRDVTGVMQDFMSKIISTARVVSSKEPTVEDRQATQQGGIVHMNHDLVVTGIYEVRMVFPISSIILSNPRGSGRRVIRTTVRMPIERPLKS